VAAGRFRGVFPRLKLIFLLLEQHVEGGEGAVAFGDVLLELDLFAVGQFFVGVDLLLEDAEVVADHDDFVIDKNPCDSPWSHHDYIESIGFG